MHNQSNIHMQKRHLKDNDMYDIVNCGWEGKLQPNLYLSTHSNNPPNHLFFLPTTLFLIFI